ncbi:methyltransferase domain-containing protein [Mycobacterium cookii]|uniref:methyltransferase domain-containing protein n=1 Tax=Mycobacterium cookii TaxID=1775 RepID=UPI0035575D71
MAAVAGQLGRPHGLVGRGVAVLLNRGNRPAVAGAVDAAEATAEKSVADIGFGGGLGLDLFLRRVGPQGTVYGVEVAEDMLTRARARFASQIEAGRLRLVNGSLTALPLEDGSLDAAISVNTAYFVSDVDAACAELARVLRPGGRAVLGIGDPAAMARLPFTAYGFNLRPIAEIVATMENAGFMDVEQRRLGEVAIAHHLLVGLAG